MKKLLLTALAVFALPLVAQAQNYNEIDGYYVGVASGVNFNHYGNKRVRFDSDCGYLVSGSIGVKTCYDLRFEGEVSYRRNQLDKIKVRIEDQKLSTKLGGDISSLAFMANAIYDIPVCFALKPYVGAGIGYARNHFETRFNVGKEKIKGKHHKNGFAWQGIAGVAYSLADCGYKTVDLTLDYRYFRPNVRHCRDHSLALGIRTAL